MIPGFDCPVKSSGQSCDEWSTEWTYSDTANAPALDTVVGEGGAWTDFDPRVPEDTRVTDSGAGHVTVRFPKSRRARVSFVGFEPVTKTTSHFRHPIVTDIDAIAGTCEVYLLDNANAPTDADEIGARVRLVLDLEHR